MNPKNARSVKARVLDVTVRCEIPLVWRLVFAGCLMLPLAAMAQGVGRVQPSRDPAAVQLLTNTLNLSGGQSVWTTIHSVRTIGELSVKKVNDPESATINSKIDWLDDWSTGHPRYRKTTTNSEGKSYTLRHGDNVGFTAHNQGKALTVSFDKANLLLTHLPAAALCTVLNDTDYAISSVTQTKDNEHNEVLVSKPDGSMTQVWYLSKETGQVDAVRYTLPSVLNTQHHPWEVVIYKHFRTENALSVPDEVVILRPNSVPINAHYHTLEVNPSVSASDFTSGSAQ